MSEAGHHDGDTRLPEGQVETRLFPRTGERAPPPEAHDPAAWRLEVGGLVARPLVLSCADVRAFRSETFPCDIHCVTGWSRRGLSFTGVPLATILASAGPRPGARYVRFEAHSPRAHDTSLPLKVAREETWLVHGLDGRPLPPEHGGPLRTVTPSRWFYKSLKWVRRIELLAEDRLGYWERDEGYDNVADPFRGLRFVTGDLKRSDLEALRGARSLAPFRGRLVLGAVLRDWDPEDRDLRRLLLRACDAEGAQLSGVDLREANLTRTTLRGASLAGADLRGADLEGTDFAGADLTNADLRGALLLAVRFEGTDDDGRPLRARVEGMRWTAGAEVLEEAANYLRASGAVEVPATASE